MHPSRVLSLKSLASKIHPPLPLTRRESAKIFELLTTTFRQQLNKEHTETRGSESSTEAHINKILRNPLIDSQPSLDKGSYRNGTQKELVSPVLQVQDLLNDPMDFFRRQAASGQASLSTARACMEMLGSPPTVLREIQKKRQDPKIADPIFQWLWSSGLEESMEFAHHHVLVRYLVTWAIFGGKVELVRSWFNRLTSETEPAQKDFIAAGVILNSAVKTLSHTQAGSIHEALKIFLDAQQQISRLTTEDARLILHKPGTFLANFLFKHRRATTTTTLYDPFVQSVDQWCPTVRRETTKAHLLIFGPHPDPVKASKILRSIKEPSVLSQNEFLEVGMAVTRKLVAQKNFKGAESLTHYLQETFPFEASKTPKPKESNTKRVLEEGPDKIQFAFG